MALLKKSQIASPVLPREAVDVAELGGEVVVRGLLFSERLALFSRVGGDGKAYAEIPELLALTVLDADDAPVFTAAEWEQFGAKHMEAMLRLFGIAKRLSGLDAEAAAKN